MLSLDDLVNCDAPKKKKKKKKKKPVAKHLRKVDNHTVDQSFLNSRVTKTFGKPKWVEFCEVMMQNGLKVNLYEARQTVSKYLTVTDGEKTFKVRYSNHKPIFSREVKGDCDFFVGVSNLGVTTTPQAIIATLKHFGKY